MIPPDTDEITFTSTLLKDNTAVWWYRLQVSDEIPTTWAEFEAAIREEFISEGHNRRTHDRLRQCPQNISVSVYISSWRNVALLVDVITEGEKWDRFVEGLKPEIVYDVKKDNCMNFTDAAKLALRVAAASRECF